MGRTILIHSVVFTVLGILFTINYLIQSRKIKSEIQKYDDARRKNEDSVLMSTRGRVIKKIETLKRTTKNNEA